VRDSLKRIIAEWLEEYEIPQPVRRDLPEIDLSLLPDILAIVGPRRAGKTYYMFQLIRDLLGSGRKKQEILFVDMEDFRLADFKASDFDDLLLTFRQLAGQSPEYLFLDEIQHLPEWSRVLRTLHNKGQYKIVISGSNSQLLTREVATELRGRYRDRLIMPFSFVEILRYNNIDYTASSPYVSLRGDILRIFDEYRSMGGFPQVLGEADVRQKRSILDSYFSTIYYRDIIDRHNVRSEAVLNSMMRYIIDTSGTLFSVSRFTKILQQEGHKVGKQTISQFLKYLQEAFFLIPLEKFDYSPRKRLMNPRKVYLLDVGFSLLSTAFSENRGRQLENIVAGELFRRGEKTFYYKDKRECDFVVMHGRKAAKAIQVTWDLDPANRDREIKGLSDAMTGLDLENGLILTYDREDEIEVHGKKVKVLPVWMWLLGLEEI